MKIWCFVIALCLDSAVGMKAHSLKMAPSNVSNVSFLGHQEVHEAVAKGGIHEATVETVSQTNPKMSNFVGCPMEFPTLEAGMGYQGDKCTGKSTWSTCPLGCYRHSYECLKAGTRSVCDVQDPTMCIAPFAIMEKSTGPDQDSKCKLSSRYPTNKESTVAPKGCLTMRDSTHSSWAVQSNQFASPFLLVQLTSQKCLRVSTFQLVWDTCSEYQRWLWETIPSTAISSFLIKSRNTKKCVKLKSHSSGSLLYASAACQASDESLWFSKIEQEGTWQFVLQHVKSGLCIQTVGGVPKVTTNCVLAGTDADGPAEQFPRVKGKFLLYYARTGSALGAYTSQTDRTADKLTHYGQGLRFGATNPLDENVHFEKTHDYEFSIFTGTRRRSSMLRFKAATYSSRRRWKKKDLTMTTYKGDKFRKIFLGGGGLFLLQHVKTGKCLDLKSRAGRARVISDCKDNPHGQNEWGYMAFRMLPAKVPPCRVSSKDYPSVQAPFVGWKLVASSTHGVKTEIEVGLSTTDGTSSTKEEVQEFQNSISVGATLGTEAEAGVLFAKAKVSAEFRFDYTHTWTESHATARSTESAETQQRVTSVSVSCPDPDPSVKMEYIYQWVAQNDKIVIKTEHFRCHQTDGPEYPPECPPQLCGDPKTNPYCAVGPEGCGAGAGRSR